MTKRKAHHAGMKVGSKEQVTIPLSLGHGAVGAGGLIPPNVPIK